MNNTISKIRCLRCDSVNFEYTDKPDGASGGADVAVRCKQCEFRYPVLNGIIDTVGDSCDRVISNTQRAMEASFVAAVYEKIWRPLITIPFSSLRWEMKQVAGYLDLSPHHELLDIACGPGNFTRMLADKLTAGSLIGTDLSKPMLIKGAGYLKKYGNENIALVRSDVSQWVFADKAFDRVSCAGALHLFHNMKEMVHSIYSSLRAGGIFVGATYIKSENRFVSAFQKMYGEKQGFHWFTVNELQGLFSGAGFSDFQYTINKIGIVFRADKK